jgi:dynein heavy chain
MWQRLVMEALCIIKKVGPVRIPDPSGNGKQIIDYWEPAKKYVLSDPKLLRSLVEFDKDNVDIKIIKKIREYVRRARQLSARLFHKKGSVRVIQ